MSLVWLRRRGCLVIGLLIGLVAVSALPPAGRAQSPPPGSPAPVPDRAVVREATETVMNQLDAFRRGDFAAAYAFASRLIHSRFDEAAFERMVTVGYPEIARSVSALVTGVRASDAGGLYLHVRVRGVGGGVVEAIYEMVREGGQWRINGVVTRPDASEPA
jgi:hypothetical protein